MISLRSILFLSSFPSEFSTVLDLGFLGFLRLLPLSSLLQSVHTHDTDYILRGVGHSPRVEYAAIPHFRVLFMLVISSQDLVLYISVHRKAFFPWVQTCQHTFLNCSQWPVGSHNPNKKEAVEEFLPKQECMWVYHPHSQNLESIYSDTVLLVRRNKARFEKSDIYLLQIEKKGKEHLTHIED